MLEKINGMFENAGKILKLIARIELLLGEIGAVVCSIALGFRLDKYGDSYFHFGQFLLILIVLVFSVFISSVMFYAFGKTVDNISALREKISPVEIDRDIMANTSTSVPTKVKLNKDGSWNCRYCNALNVDSTAHKCSECGRERDS